APGCCILRAQRRGQRTSRYEQGRSDDAAERVHGSPLVVLVRRARLKVQESAPARQFVGLVRRFRCRLRQPPLPSSSMRYGTASYGRPTYCSAISVLPACELSRYVSSDSAKRRPESPLRSVGPLSSRLCNRRLSHHEKR